jgi:hypothetical protein
LTTSFENLDKFFSNHIYAGKICQGLTSSPKSSKNKNKFDLRAFLLSLFSGIRRKAVRVWLETALPPVFGKEMEEKSRYLEHGYRLFFDKSTNNTPSPSPLPAGERDGVRGDIFDPFVVIRVIRRQR